ncbi:winged helix DNA-binding protein [Pseudokineococcus lusitanus]|uniref:Winged helix DNA-binding protein n=1 Tax=Pseudokineococcus lusitanus TaxID=763993 RepID=A0A3N1HQP0_9ACTN|nr:winged helix DNA-binding protein [Pseudokineococcus lusitanus]
MLRVSRRRALAARLVAQGLDARGPDVAALAVLDVGLADSPYGAARVAAAARTTGPVDDVGRHDGPLPTAWTVRGAPHVHRAVDLPTVGRAVHPVSDDDVRARLVSPQAAGARELGLEAWRLVTAAVRAVAAAHGGVVAKGDLSREVSDRVPASLTHRCDPCDAQHVSALTFQPAGLQAGLVLDTTARALVLRSLPGWPDDLGVPDPAAVGALLRRLVDLHGPVAPGDLAALVGTSARVVHGLLPADLVPVEVDGRAALATPWFVALLEDPGVEERAAGSVRLLPPGDPWLQSRDRALTVPDPGRRKQVWRPLGSPGVVLAAGEAVGTWRAKAGPRRSAGRRDDVVVTPWAPWADAEAGAVAEEALVVARARGADDVRLVVES